MKKLLIALVLSVIIAASTAFGQGYIVFTGAPRTVWDNTGSSPTTDSGFVTTFLWAPSTTTSAAVDAIMASTPTNYTASAPSFGSWPFIENLSGGWQFAVDAGTGNNPIGVPANNLGGFAYDPGSAFALSGSTGPGETISIYVIAWETDGGLYTTLAAAEAGDVAVGWSSVFQYTLGSGPPATPPASTTIPKFGIDTPEPTTLALVGLGGISILFLRRSRGDETLIKIGSR